MLNPWLLLAGIVLWLSSIYGAFIFGGSVKDGEWNTKIVAQKDEREASLKAAAEAIAKIDVKTIVVNKTLEKEIKTNTVYAECRHTPDSFNALNKALKNEESTPSK